MSGKSIGGKRVALFLLLAYLAWRTVAATTVIAADPGIWDPGRLGRSLTRSERERIEIGLGREGGLYRLLRREMGPVDSLLFLGTPDRASVLAQLQLAQLLFPRPCHFTDRLPAVPTREVMEARGVIYVLDHRGGDPPRPAPWLEPVGRSCGYTLYRLQGDRW